MGSVTEIKFTGTCSSDITTAEADSYRNNVCKQFMAVEGRRLTIEIHVDDKTNQLTLSFHNAAEQIVQRFKVENPEFYRLAREYRSAVTIYEKAEEEGTADMLELLGHNRRRCHSAGAEALAAIIKDIGLPYDAVRPLFYLCAHAIRATEQEPT